MRRRNGLDRSTPRAGFTLIEMIVVMGIIMMLMGLALSGVFSSRKIDRLVATEQVVADIVRQARHAARSTGEPVVVEIRKDTRDIAGVSRVPIRTEQFESLTALEGGVPGHSGQGWCIEAVTPTHEPWQSGAWPRSSRLVRSTTGTHSTPGFYLGCDVRVTASLGGPGSPQPLVCVTLPGATAAPKFTDTVCGIALMPQVRTMQMQGLNPVAPIDNWSVVGWVHDDAGNLSVVDSQANLPLDRIDVVPDPFTQDNPVQYDFVGPLGGGWTDLGLLFDGERLVLYRDGVRIAEAEIGATGAAIHLLELQDEQLAAGMIDEYPNPSGGFFGPLEANASVLDDVRLFRLATDQVGALPNGVAPRKDYRITANPDGRVEVNARDAMIAAQPDTAAGRDDLLNVDEQRLYFAGTQDVDGTTGLWGVVTVQSNGRTTSAIRQLATTNDNPDTIEATPP